MCLYTSPAVKLTKNDPLNDTSIFCLILMNECINITSELGILLQLFIDPQSKGPLVSGFTVSSSMAAIKTVHRTEQRKD